MKPLRSNPKNDRAKREYLIWLKEARQRSPATIEQARHRIDRLELYTGFKDFRTCNKDQALGFKRALVAAKAKRSGKPISTATAHHILQAIKEFLLWLNGRPGYRRRIDLAHIAYLNLTMKDERVARVTSPKSYASLEQYRAALFAMPGRAILKAAFTRVDLPYFKPHTVRDTLTQLAYRLQLGPEQLKAWSQNMGAFERADHTARLWACLNRAARGASAAATPLRSVSARIRESR